MKTYKLPVVLVSNVEDRKLSREPTSSEAIGQILRQRKRHSEMGYCKKKED
jgi:hypothetical protein